MTRMELLDILVLVLLLIGLLVLAYDLRQRKNSRSFNNHTDQAIRLLKKGEDDKGN